MSRLILLGVGAAGSAMHAPAGLLLEYGHLRIGFDGGPGAQPPDNVHAWLVSDPYDPLQPERRRIAREAGMPEPVVSPFDHGSLRIAPLPIPGHAYGYRIDSGARCAVWAPHADRFPAWAGGADLMFAAAVVAPFAVDAGVRRLVIALLPEAGADGDGSEVEWGAEGRGYRL